jgi:hypothetical protein
MIEGMIGSGKTMTATRVGEWLARRGESVRVFCEGAADHPIRTGAEDRLRAAAGLRAPGPEAPGTRAALGVPGRSVAAAGRALRARPADDHHREQLPGEQPLGAPPRSSWPGRRGQAVPGLGARRDSAVPRVPVPEDHGDRPPARLAGDAGAHLRNRAPSTHPARSPDLTHPGPGATSNHTATRPPARRNGSAGTGQRPEPPKDEHLTHDRGYSVSPNLGVLNSSGPVGDCGRLLRAGDSRNRHHARSCAASLLRRLAMPG